MEIKLLPALALAVLPMMASCIGPLELKEVLLWEGALEPMPAASTPIAGTMAMVANEGFTQVGIGIDAGEPGTVLGWMVRHGSCDSPGQRVAPPETFLPVEIRGSGEAEQKALVNYRLSRVPGYVGQVTAEADGSGEVIACAELLERD